MKRLRFGEGDDGGQRAKEVVGGKSGDCNESQVSIHGACVKEETRIRHILQPADSGSRLSIRISQLEALV